MKNRNNIIGVDIGGVIIGRIHDKADTSFFGANYLETPQIEGAFESLRNLTEAGFLIYLVSKCGKEVQEKSLNWLEHHYFFESTGVEKSNLRFCKTRPEKAGICTELGANYFVDDRLEILSYLHDVEHRFLFNANDKEVMRFARFATEVHRTDSWAEIEKMIIPSTRQLRGALHAP